MRDAFGGAYMFQIMIVFIFIYVGFIAIALNYGRGFRIKNEVIDFLEENEINNIDSATAQDEIKSMLDQKGFTQNDLCTSELYSAESGNKCINNVIITPHTESKNGVDYVYYTVDSHIRFNLGFLNFLFTLARSNERYNMAGYWRMSGETRVIVSN